MLELTMDQNIEINEFSEVDRGEVEKCITELQEHERKIDQNKKPGIEIAKEYLDYLIKQCEENSGQIFVAKIESVVVGFSCVWIESENDPTSYARKIGYFSDLYTKPEYRRMGIGSMLIRARKDYVKSKGINLVRVCTLASNPEIQETLKAQGFAPYEITWEAQV